jgi:2Fe-2S ferredoxin
MKLKFLPQNVEVDINPNKSVMNMALESGIPIHSICKGVPSCAECRIKIVEGESYVTKPSKAELALIGNSYYLDGRRLSCQVRCFGPVTVDTAEQINRQDNPAKKIRGFKTEKQYESKAILDTMILDQPSSDAKRK